MHADEVDTDAELVRRLVSAQFPQWGALPVEPVLPRGTDNALYRLGTHLVARLPRRPGTDGTLKRECRWLPKLAPRLPLPVPTPLGLGLPGEGFPFEWAVYPWLAGETATDGPLGDRRQVAVDLASFIGALQRIDATGGPGPAAENFNRGEPVAKRDTATRAAIASLGSRIDAAAVTEAWDAALAAPVWERPPVWFHGDLDARNLLVQHGRLSGVIDFGCVGVGDPACDVAAAWKVLSADSREVFRSVLSVDEATWQRARGWVLSQSVMALAYYTLETNAILVREAERWLADVLTDDG